MTLTVLDRVTITTWGNRFEVWIGITVGCSQVRVINKHTVQVVRKDRREWALTATIPGECLRVCAICCTGVPGVWGEGIDLCGRQSRDALPSVESWERIDNSGTQEHSEENMRHNDFA
jgi:hypothetical protein